MTNPQQPAGDPKATAPTTAKPTVPAVDDKRPAGDPAGKPPTSPLPPWGSDENFDPQKAWGLIQNLRAEKGILDVPAEIAKERTAREAIEAKFVKLGEALGVREPEKNKSEIDQITERLAKHEEELAGERHARWRAEIANEKGLTVPQAERLQGKTREEMAADADALKALFPSTPAAPGTPRPDPTQGSQGGAGVDIDALIAEATKSGNVREAIRLKNQKHATKK